MAEQLKMHLSNSAAVFLNFPHSLNSEHLYELPERQVSNETSIMNAMVNLAFTFAVFEMLPRSYENGIY